MYQEFGPRTRVDRETMFVRRFQEGDEGYIATIHNEGFREWIDSLSLYYGYVRIRPDDVRKWKSRDGLFLAEMGGQPVGYAHFGVWNVAGVWIGAVLAHEGDGEYGQAKIAVIPERRRMAVGSELVKTGLHYVREKGKLAFARVYSDNAPARNLFSKLGFLHFEGRFHHPIISKDYPLYFADTRCAVFDLTQPIPRVRMNTQVEVREAGREDVEKLSDYATEITRYLEYFRNTSREHLLDWISEKEVVIVAELKGRIVGCIDAEKITGHLGVPGVLPEFRRKDIGSTLLHGALRVLRARHYAKALTDTEVVNEPAWRLYRKLGFKEDRRIEVWVKPL